jgi:hypothetical protein
LAKHCATRLVDLSFLKLQSRALIACETETGERKETWPDCEGDVDRDSITDIMKKGRRTEGNENDAWLALHEGRNAQRHTLVMIIHSEHPRIM